METFEFKPKGVCSTKMTFLMEGDIIKDVKIENGCAGNLLGISRLIKDKTVDEVVEAFRGVMCRSKPTSCPDQIAQALLQYEKASIEK